MAYHLKPFCLCDDACLIIYLLLEQARERLDEHLSKSDIVSLLLPLLELWAVLLSLVLRYLEARLYHMIELITEYPH